MGNRLLAYVHRMIVYLCLEERNMAKWKIADKIKTSYIESITPIRYLLLERSKDICNYCRESMRGKYVK